MSISRCHSGQWKCGIYTLMLLHIKAFPVSLLVAGQRLAFLALPSVQPVSAAELFFKILIVRFFHFLFPLLEVYTVLIGLLFMCFVCSSRLLLRFSAGDRCFFITTLNRLVSFFSLLRSFYKSGYVTNSLQYQTFEDFGCCLIKCINEGYFAVLSWFTAESL